MVTQSGHHFLGVRLEFHALFWGFLRRLWGMSQVAVWLWSGIGSVLGRLGIVLGRSWVVMETVSSERDEGKNGHAMV